MPHRIRVTVPTIEVGKNDIHVIIQRNSEKIGELLISKGNIQWWPKGHKKLKKQLRWAEFAAFMDEWGTTVRH